MPEEIIQPLDYYAGLIDAIGRVNFEVKKTDHRVIGYDVRPSLVFHVGQQDFLDALLGTFFEDHGIGYTFRREGTKSRFMLVEDNESFRKLQAIFDGQLVQLSTELSFIVDSYLPARHSGELAAKYGHLQLMKAIADLQPERAANDNTKHTAGSFAREFDIELASVSRLEIPSASYRSELTADYLSGFFDGRGWCSVAISENETFSVGYSCTPRVELTRPHANPALKRLISEFLDAQGIHANFYSQDGKLSVVVTELETIPMLFELLLETLWERREQVAYFSDVILPRFHRNDHHTKQGLYEISTLAEPLFRSTTGKQRQYDASYFEERWGDELVVRERATLIEDSQTDDAVRAPPETYLPAIDTDADRRSPDSAFRRAVLERYGHNCAITGLGDTRLLEVAHIVPWAADSDGRDDPSNAVVLNPLHHEAYDRGLFVIDTEYRVHVAPELDDEYLDEQLASYDGTRLEFPEGAGPDRAALEARNDEVRWWQETSATRI
ncbi:HNH endonuclease [Halobacteria archaeon AArc-m2/3/4]|uniref:HNH endonuclease n=1 Tax=Natronoglomus mannanivorans TaxID=2979990 RepID=A0ABT2QLA4_9EURY|nr:HNH endonuclease [Halobacteria archaeon AArc-m2/3/4]